jgi:hypothetical protein
MAWHHLEAVRTKIAELVRLSQRLQRAIDECSGNDGHCPVIEMLDCAPHIHDPDGDVSETDQKVVDAVLRS